MSIILAIVIGLIALLAGVGLAYSLLEHRLNLQEKRHRSRTRREIEDVERSYSDRMQQRIDALKAQYETQIQQLTANPESSSQFETLKQQYESQIGDLTQQLQSAQLASAQQIDALKAQYEAQIQTLTQQLESTELEPTQLEPTQLESTELEPTQLEPTQLEPTQLEVVSPSPAVAIDSEPDPVLELVLAPDPVLEPVLEPALETIPVESLDPPHTLTIASRSEGRLTLETVKNLPYAPQDNTRILLAEHLLEILESQTRTEIPQVLLLQTLKRLSEDPVPRLRELGVRCLASTHSSLAVPLLRPRLRDTDATVVQAAHQALDFWRAHGKVKPQKGKSKTRKSRPKS